MRLLLIEDDALVGTGMRSALRAEGYAVDWVHDATTASDALTTPESGFALAVLDLDLADEKAVQLLDRLQSRRNEISVLAITRRENVQRQMHALRDSADDFLLRPFGRDEMIERVRALLRRRIEKRRTPIEYAGFRLDPSAQTLTFFGMDIKVSRREFSVLEALLEKGGGPLSRAALEKRIYGDSSVELTGNSIEVHIHNLRKKLGRGTIRTMRCVGYVIDADTRPQPALSYFPNRIN